MSVGVVNRSALDWERFAEGVRFAADWGDVSRRLGLARLGCGIWTVPTRKASVPYHYHLVNEEMALVLEGEIDVRLETGEHRLRAGDIVALPPGREGAHQFLNRGHGPAVLLLASTLVPREVAGYPDSGKWLYHVRHPGRDGPAQTLIVKDDRILDGGRGPFCQLEPVEEPLEDRPEPPRPRDPRIVALDDLPWEPNDLGPFGSERRRAGRAVGSVALGYGVVRIAPDRRPWPYHFHHVNDELFYVLAGDGELRSAAGVRPIGPGDAIGCPAGPGGAHQVRADGAAPLVLFAVSTMIDPEVCEYPDSGKLYVMVGSAPGGDPTARSVDLVLRRSDATGYLDGEPETLSPTEEAR